MDNAVKAATVVLALAIAVVLFMVLRGDDNDDATTTPVAPSNEQFDSDSKGDDKDKPKKDKPKPPTKPEVPTILVKGGQPVGGVQELTFQSGSQMRFAVEADVTDHAHLHGYDVSEDVAPGKAARFDLPADIEGVFELELEAAGLPIAEISVTP